MMLPWDSILRKAEKPQSEESKMALYPYESQMNGMKKVSDKKSLQGAKTAKTNASEKAHPTPYDASQGQYLKKGGKTKKMAMGGAAKVRKGMMSAKGKPTARSK